LTIRPNNRSHAWHAWLCAQALAAAVALCSPAAAQTASDDGQTSAALAFASDGKLTPAERVEKIQAIVDANPGKAELWAVLGEALEAAGKPEEALGAFDRAVEMDPTLHSAWSWVGTLNKRLRLDLGRAEMAFRKALEHGAPVAPTNNELGVTLAIQGRFKESLGAFDAAIAADPEWGVLYNNAIKAALSAGMERRAREYFVASLDADRFEPACVMLWGEHLVAGGKPRQAAADYAIAVEKHPDLPRIRYYYGAALSETGRKGTPQAIAELRRAKADAERLEDWTTARNCIRTLFAIENPREERDFKRAVDLVFKAERSEEEAIENVEKAMKLLNPIAERFPDFFNVFLVRGLAHRGLQDYPAAEKDLRRALELQPTEPNAAIHLAITLAAAGRVEEAMPFVDQAVEFAPRDPTVLMNAAFVRLDAGRCAEAEDLVPTIEALVGPQGVQPLVDEIAVRCRKGAAESTSSK
jgi:tetratricopeptide (TPR) repeat protein